MPTYLTWAHIFSVASFFSLFDCFSCCVDHVFSFVNKIHLIDFALFFSSSLYVWSHARTTEKYQHKFQCKMYINVHIMESSNQYFVNASSLPCRESNRIEYCILDWIRHTVRLNEWILNARVTAFCTACLYDYRRSMWSQHSLNSNDVDIWMKHCCVPYTRSHSPRSNCINAKQSQVGSQSVRVCVAYSYRWTKYKNPYRFSSIVLNDIICSFPFGIPLLSGAEKKMLNNII